MQIPSHHGRDRLLQRVPVQTRSTPRERQEARLKSRRPRIEPISRTIQRAHSPHTVNRRILPEYRLPTHDRTCTESKARSEPSKPAPPGGATILLPRRIGAAAVTVLLVPSAAIWLTGSRRRPAFLD